MTELPPPAPQPSGPKAPLWMKIALGVSVALNLAVAGMAGGAAWRFHSEGVRPAPVRDLGFGPFSEALEPGDRAAMRRELVEDRGDFRAMRRGMREDFAAILTALRAEPYDPAAVEAAFERQRVRGMQIAERGARLMTERIAGMSPDQRRAFADRLEGVLTRRGPHGEPGRPHEHPRRGGD